MVLLLILFGAMILFGLIFIIISIYFSYKITFEELNVYNNHLDKVRDSVRGNMGKTESYVVLEIRRKRNNLPWMKF